VKLSEIGGLTLVGLGFFVLYTRGLVGLLNLSYVFVTGIGLLAALLGLNYFNVGRQTRRRATVVDDVEPRYEVPVPGDDTDELLADSRGLSRASIKRRREFHERLERVAHETLAARGDYPSEAAARRAVETGAWTDDPVAAWFLGDTPEPPLSVRLRGVLGSDTEFGFAARRTIAALGAVREGRSALDDRDPPADGADLLGRVRRRLPVSRAVGLFDGRGDDGDATGSEREDTWKLTEADG
jgi:hypothetical protein